MAPLAPMSPLPAKSIATLGHALCALLTGLGDILRSHLKQPKPSLVFEAWKSLGCPNLPRHEDELSLGVVLEKRKTHLVVQEVTFGVSDSSSSWLLSRWALHLPSLRSRLIAQLTLARYVRLKSAVAPVWLKPSDAQQPPPGTVISGLGTPSWSEIPHVQLQEIQHSTLGLWLEPTRTHNDEQWLVTYERSRASGRIELVTFAPKG